MPVSRQAAAVLESTREGVVITDLQARIVAINPAYTQITGMPRRSAGQNPQHVGNGRQDQAFGGDVAQRPGERTPARRDLGTAGRTASSTPVARHQRGQGCGRPALQLRGGDDRYQSAQGLAGAPGIPGALRPADLAAQPPVVAFAPYPRPRERRSAQAPRRCSISTSTSSRTSTTSGHPVGDELLEAFAQRLPNASATRTPSDASVATSFC